MRSKRILREFVRTEERLERARADRKGATITPTPTNGRSANALRPDSLHGMVGQAKLRRLLIRLTDAANARQAPLDHMLLVGPSGYGKTTVANAVANALGVQVWQIEAPVSHDTLTSLRTAMADRDILFVDEIHQQGIMDRRSRDSSTQPEVLFSVMEDRTLVTGSGVLPFPLITVIGATTDEGRLPDAFVNRFPLHPEFDAYTVGDLVDMALLNAKAFNLAIEDEAAERFAFASRGIPRIVNNYVRNAASLTDSLIDETLAEEVIEDLNQTSEDGLTKDMRATLVFLYEKCRRLSGDDTIYQASLTNIATAIGKSRDVKAVQLRIEPYLIQQGYLQVGHGGRRLTDLGIARVSAILNHGATP
jgi:Holliday junction DNA helicase RuvB